MSTLGDCPNRQECSGCAPRFVPLQRHRHHRFIGPRLRATLVFGTVLIFFVASPVLGQTGINLSWDDCGASGSSARTFACNTNAGSNVLIASFVAPPGLCIIGCTGVLDLQTSGAAVPAWWQFKNVGSCRQTALSASADFFPNPFSCLDEWLEEAISGVFAYEVGLGSPNRARIWVGVAKPSGTCQPHPGGVEILAFQVIIRNDKTTGSGSCAGCDEGVCIVFNALSLHQYLDPPEFYLTTPLSRNFVTWQAGIPNCPGATPVLNRTWGAVKALYR